MRLAKVASLSAAMLFSGFFAQAEDPERILDTIITTEDNVPSVEDYVAEATFTGLEMSPNGKYVAGVRRDGYDYYLVVADLEAEELQFTGTFFNDIIINEINWASDDRLIIEAVAVFHGDTMRLMDPKDWFDLTRDRVVIQTLYMIDRDGENLIRVFEGDKLLDNVFSDTQLLDVSIADPDHILVQSRRVEINDRRSGSYEYGGADLYKVDINTGEYESYVRGQKRTQRYESDSDGQVKYRVDENAAGNRDNYYVADVTDDGRIRWSKGASVSITDLENELDQPFKINILAPAEEAPLFYVRDVPQGEDRHAIYVYDISTSEHVEMIAAHPEYDMGGGREPASGIIMNPNNRELIGVSWSGKKPEMLLFDPNLQRHVEALESYFGDQLNFTLIDKSMDGNKWLLNVEGPGHSGFFALYELDKVKITELGDQRAPLSGKATYSTKIVSYKARDGKEIFGYLTLPFGEEKGKHPFVMYPHGGPQARDFFRWDDTVQLLASRGYAVFQPQFRGSAGFGKKYAEAGYREWGGLMQTDVEDGLKHIIAEGYVDADRGCIMGFSYGAYATMQGAVATPDDYRCALAGGGVYDLFEMQRWSRAVRGQNSSTFEYWTTQLGDPNDNYDDLIARSPARNLDKLKIPVFLFHGKRDNIVPIEQAEMLRNRLRSAGADFEYVVMRKAGHQFGAPRTEEPREIREDILLFLATHNPTDRNKLRQPLQ
jgi:dipeptidyl aminopeptidase/acylaminoacyl peptidase